MANEENVSDVPDKLNEILQDIGIFVPDDDAPDNPVYQRMLNGFCATCGHELGTETMALIGQPVGLGKVMGLMLFCGGPCMSDMQVVGWMQEQHDQIVQNIRFRSGEINADGPGDTVIEDD